MASCSGQNADDKFSFDEEYNIPTSQMYLRDPFIYADESKQRYYIVHNIVMDSDLLLPYTTYEVTMHLS